MDIRQNKTNNTTPVFKAICDTFNTYIPAMHVRGADTFVSTTKQQKPTKEQLLSRLKNVDIPEESKIEIEKYAKEDLQIEQAYKLLSDPRLYQNQNILDSLYGILSSSCKHNFEDRNALIDKYLSTPALYENKGISSSIGDLIKFANGKEKSIMADFILSTPELYSSEEFTQHISELGYALNGLNKERILNKFLRREALYKNKELQSSIIDYLKSAKNGAQENYACEVLDYVEQGIVSPQLAIQLVKHSEFKIEPENFKKLQDSIEPTVYEQLSIDRNDIISASRIIPLFNKASIAEIPKEQRNEVLKGLVKSNSRLFKTTDVLKKYFPLIPQTKEEYCSFVPALATSIGIETKSLIEDQVDDFFIDLNNLSSEIAKLSDEEFERLELSQKYSTNDFIMDTLNAISDLSETEKQIVCDYFGFELKEDKNSSVGFSLIGYPINTEAPEKLEQITDEKTKIVIENLRKNVVEYSENNAIISNNEKIGELLNGIQVAFPEIHTMIFRQTSPKEEDILKHSLRVMKNLVQNPQFENLNDSDKKVILLTTMLHNIRANTQRNEKENKYDDFERLQEEKALKDLYHRIASRYDSDSDFMFLYEEELYRRRFYDVNPKQTQAIIQAKKLQVGESAFDAYFLSSKFNLSTSEQIKLYTLIKNQNWLEEVSERYVSRSEEINKMQNLAYDMQNDNTFELAKMFVEASLKSAKMNDYSYERSIDSLSEHLEIIECYIDELKSTKPILPTTKLPKASEVNSRITTVNEDYSTNLKGVYKKDGLTIIRYNEVEDWEELGFPKGSISTGIKKSGYHKKDTGTIKFISHWVYNEESVANFKEFNLPDSDALLSASYVHSPESKVFNSGLLLDVATEHIHGGHKGDTYSGGKKTLNKFKSKIFEEYYSGYDRNFFAELLKKELGYSDEQYIAFVKENMNKSMSEIQPEELRNSIIKAFSSIHSSIMTDDYNEIYVSNAKVQACYSTTMKSNRNIIDAVDNAKDYLKDYAKQNDLLFFVFGG